MMQFNRFLINRQLFTVVMTSKRTKMKIKKNWHGKQRKSSSTSQLALDYFDHFYGPIFQAEWPRIRLSLLSPQKYVALMNNFSHFNAENEQQIQLLGAIELNKLSESLFDFPILEKIFQKNVEKIEEKNEKNEKNEEIDQQKDEFFRETVQMAPEERLEAIEIEQNQGFFGKNESFPKISDENWNYPANLKAFAFGPGEVARFPPSESDSNGYLGYYLMDGASLLPVLALNLLPTDTVLDMCAAPGGKSLAILQTLLPAHLTCNDVNFARVGRIMKVMRSFVPEQYRAEPRVRISKCNGRAWAELNSAEQYDKVLVDVPCSNDRLSVLRDEENIFSRARLAERVELPQIQRELLEQGILACKPGGNIVYSTCSLAPVQNDAVVQAAVENVSQKGARVCIVKMDKLRRRMSSIFCFYSQTRFGLLVLPTIVANYGPMYIAKIARIS